MNVAGPSQGAYIAPLPASTKSKLRSTQILTSLPQVVSELVQNSLDAGARTIDVSLDPDEWECWVRDDGAGIPRDGLALLAGGAETGRYGRWMVVERAPTQMKRSAEEAVRYVQGVYTSILERSHYVWLPW